MQYLKSVRITMAIELLVKTKHSVTEIANKVGYDSLPLLALLSMNSQANGLSISKKQLSETVHLTSKHYLCNLFLISAYSD